MRKHSWFLVPALVLSVSAALIAQNKPTIKQVPPSRTNASSGAEMYRTYCAVCHGMDGKGKGPASPALKVQATDLTVMAKNNGGKFPELKVYNSIRGEVGVAAHGSKDMPIWGDVFRDLGRGDSSETSLRLRNLTKHIESMQTK
ncbi:MAG: c-type cytochrome [Bryobacterales bacterium]|nr:c-type cytochrome [Bryobacterales bacterium]